jgi:tetratricopeptide (TPR) repeat protein
MARFYLGVALRRCGENQLAAMHFEELETLLKEADRQLSMEAKKIRSQVHTPLVRHLTRYPQCPFLLLYNRAMALSNSHRPCQLLQAIELLDQIVVSVNATGSPGENLTFPACTSRLSVCDRNRFRILAESAQTSIWAAMIELEDSDSTISALTKRIDAVAKSLEATKDYLDPDLLTSHTFAVAIALNAQGRACSVSCSTESHQIDLAAARALFTKASVILPDFADSYLNLGSLYIRWNEEVCDCWSQEAESVLLTAIKLDPSNFQSHYLLSKLYGTDKVADYKKALELLADYKSVPEAHYQMAEIYGNTNYPGNDPDKAIESWAAGVALMSDPNQAQVDHLRVLFSLAQSTRRQSRLHDIAGEAARRLSKQGKCDSDQRLGRYWSEEVDKTARREVEV